jgi:NitT/TauT family transport system substrate-binding protein
MKAPVLDRRQWIQASAWAGLGWMASGAHAQSGKPEKSKVSIAVAGKATFYHLPLTLAEQLGYFRAEGLDVNIIDFAGGAQALRSVVGGTADVCSGPYENTIYLQAKSQLFKAFVLQGRAPQIALGVSTKTMQPYKSLADLKGKKMGVTAPGSSTHMVAHLILSRAGLKPSDVGFMGVGHSAGALSAMRSGQIDAISHIDPVMTMLEQKGDVKIVSDTRTIKGSLDVFGGPMPAACLFAPIEFMAQNPNTCQALANAIVHGLKWLQTAGPSDILKTVPEGYLLGDRALYLASFDKIREALSTDGLMHADSTQTALRALQGFDESLKADKIDLSKTFTNEFARRAKDKYKA